MTATIDCQTGAYAVLPGDVEAFLAEGFTLALTANFHPADVAPAGLVYLDPKPSKIIRATLRSYYPHAKTSPTPVALSAKHESAILSAIEARVLACAKNPSVAGFYLQDDYIGNVVALHEKVIELIRGYAPDRSAVMGFGCTLDYDKGAGFEPALTERQHFAERELLNWTPSADGALFYNYSLGNQPNSDYGMARLMPYMLDEIGARGFDLTEHMLLGGVQCWEPNATPTRGEVATQATAFANFGARAICAFTWHNFSDGQPELFNSPEMREGLKLGMQACQAYWGAWR